MYGTLQRAGINPRLWTQAYLQACAEAGGQPPPVARLPTRGALARAANWIRVGQTQGRGKLDTRNEHALPVKDILLKPIHPHWRIILNH